jgi:hypothetical protein
MLVLIKLSLDFIIVDLIINQNNQIPILNMHAIFFAIGCLKNQQPINQAVIIA